MATTLEVVNVGTAPNSRDGEPWRDALIKANTNTAIIQAFIDAEAFVKISKESDFPNQTATTITLAAKTVHAITADFTTSKNVIGEDGALWTSFNQFGPLVTYTGAGNMFSGTDVHFTITNCAINCASAQAFAFTDTVGNQKVFKYNNVTIVSCTKIGTFTGMGNALFLTGQAPNADDGITYTGTNLLAATVDKMFIASTSASFIGIDFGTATVKNLELNNLIMEAPASAVGISGATGSANVVSGFLGMVSNSSFSGGMTDLAGIATTDFKWRFTDNTPTADTVEDFLLSFNGSSTETTISVVDTPVIVNATWTCVRASLFGCTAGGRVTSLSERNITGFPIGIVLGLISAGGGSIKVTVYLAKNGSVIAGSATSINISGSNQALVPIPWQDTVEKDDFYEVYIENNTNTVNIIVESGKLRGR